MNGFKKNGVCIVLCVYICCVCVVYCVFVRCCVCNVLCVCNLLCYSPCAVCDYAMPGCRVCVVALPKHHLGRQQHFLCSYILCTRGVSSTVHVCLIMCRSFISFAFCVCFVLSMDHLFIVRYVLSVGYVFCV